ncbi:hypothetical protein [Marinomonas algicola]|uniref:hypothetical protein n=1 Tax=Marinomonas algicola TaxID=2773454 RepID=UPI00174B61DB|nr:hypothetical protein [Marinomonas algicola]
MPLLRARLQGKLSGKRQANKRLYRRLDTQLVERILQNAPLTYANVGLLILLQLCLWGGSAVTLWQDAQKTHLKIERAQTKLVFQNRLLAGDYFPESLKQYDWLSWKWIKVSCDHPFPLGQKPINQSLNDNRSKEESPVIGKAHLLSLCLEIEGTAEDQEWRVALNQLDEFAHFFPVAMRWRRVDHKAVEGTLRLQIIKNTANRLAQSFYPFAFYPDATFSDDIQLVGSAFTQHTWRSLLVIDGHSVSVGVGDWLPDVLASVVSIDKHKIELEYLNGKTVFVFLRHQLKGENI